MAAARSCSATDCATGGGCGTGQVTEVPSGSLTLDGTSQLDRGKTALHDDDGDRDANANNDSHNIHQYQYQYHYQHQHQQEEHELAEPRRPTAKRQGSSGYIYGHPQRLKQHNHHHQKQHSVGGTGRLHARVPSSKALHRHHGSSTKLNRRPHSPPPPVLGPSGPVDAITTTATTRTTTPTTPRGCQGVGGALSSAYRRVHSDVKLAEGSSYTILKRNRSYHDVARKNKSLDKIKPPDPDKHRKASKSQVRFELGTADGQADDWVDDSSVSPSASYRQGPGTDGPKRGGQEVEPPMPAAGDDITKQQKEYLTSRMLARTPSHGAPPRMSSETASQDPSQPSQVSPGPASQATSTAPSTPPTTGEAVARSHVGDELTSRFTMAPSPGLASEGSFYNSERPTSRSADDVEPRRLRSFTSLGNRSNQSWHGDPEDPDGRLAFKRPTVPPAEKSRTQQKLNLQRASSVIEPGQAGPAAAVVDPLVDVSGPGYDGGDSRDPRVGKLLERTGMEYLVVRRYQNPVVRSVDRLQHVPGFQKNKRIPASRRGPVTHASHRAPAMLHVRNGNMPDQRGGGDHSSQPLTLPRSQATRTSGAGSSLETEDGISKMGDGAGRFWLGQEDEDIGGTAAALRNLWEKSLELSASQD